MKRDESGNCAPPPLERGERLLLEELERQVVRERRRSVGGILILACYTCLLMAFFAEGNSPAVLYLATAVLLSGIGGMVGGRS